MTDSAEKTEGLAPPSILSTHKMLFVPPSTLQPILIKSGPVELVASGTIIPFSNNSIEILIGSPTPFRLLIVLEEEDQVSQTRFVLKWVDATTAQLTCFNFRKQTSAVGNVEPLLVGNVIKDPLYLNIRVQPVTGSDPIICYNLYLGKPANG